jgi:Fe-S cluster biogenesis protein NfuA
MFIQTEQTPNPASLKFLPGCEVLGRGTADFRSAEAAQPSPLALRLFKVNGVAGVFLGADFVTVSKSAESDWSALKPLILGALMEHFTTGQPVMNDEENFNDAGSTPRPAAEGDSEVVSQIKELLETRIRPVVAADGGDIAFHEFRDGVVYLEMRGACAGCPSSTMTLKAGIENLLKHFIPEVNEVRAV